MRGKLKIRGITGTPLFLTRWHGRLDGRRGVVVLNGESWTGHYIEKKLAIYHAFLHATYRDLEAQTASLHKESAALAVEYEYVKDRLAAQDAPISAGTVSGKERGAARQASERSRSDSRKLDIELRLAAIEENVIRAVSEAAAIEREAGALVERRVQAYLHGASLAAKRVQSVRYQVTAPFENEEYYSSRHKENDDVRKAILTAVNGGK